MICIFYGNHEVKVAQAVRSEIQAARARDMDIVRLDAKKLELAELETALGTDTLFATGKVVVITGLFSLPKSKRKEALITLIKAQSDAVGVIITETKTLTVTQLKTFPEAKVRVCRYPNLLFTWLESIEVHPNRRAINLLHELLDREEAELALVMLIRQVRTLLALAADDVYEGPPFLRTKLSNQATTLGLRRLFVLHSRLLALDAQQKASQLSMSLAANLDLILAEL